MANAQSLLKRPLRLPFTITKRWMLAPLAVYAASCLMLVVATLASAPLARFLADDWMMAEHAKSTGIIPTANGIYMSWGGRFSSNLIDATLGYQGTWTAPVFATVFTVAFFAATYLLINELLSLMVDASRQVTVLATTMFMGVLFYSLADIGANFAWFTGIATYSLPVLSILLCLYAILHKVRNQPLPKPQWAFFANLFLASFFASGCSEVGALAQISFAFVGIIFCLAFARGKSRNFVNISLAFVLAGALAGLYLLYIAPGNEARSIFSGGHRPLEQALTRSWSSSSRYYMSWVQEQWLLLGLMFAVLGFFCKPLRTLRPAAVLGSIALGGIAARLTLLLCTFPACYGSGISLPSRAQFALYLTLFAWAAAAGFFVGIMLRPMYESQPASRQPWLAGLVTAILVYNLSAIPAAFYVGASNTWVQAQRFARAWDARESLPRGNPGRIVQLGAWGVHDYHDNLVNRDRYGVR